MNKEEFIQKIDVILEDYLKLLEKIIDTMNKRLIPAAEDLYSVQEGIKTVAYIIQIRRSFIGEKQEK